MISTSWRAVIGSTIRVSTSPAIATNRVHFILPHSGHHGHHFHNFRDLFSVQFSRRTFRKNRKWCPGCPKFTTSSKNIHNPPRVTCPDRARSAAIRSCSFLNRRPDQYRSSPDFPPSITPISRSAAKSLFFEMCCRYPSASHHLWKVSLSAIRKIQPPGSITHSLSKNNPTVSLTVRRFPVATNTLRGCTSLPPLE